MMNQEVARCERCQYSNIPELLEVDDGTIDAGAH